MKTNQEHLRRNPQQSGNALIYVLIAVALFAALSMTLTRQTDTNEAGQLSAEQAELYATQMISTSAQIKSAVDQMLFSGSQVSDLVFELPSDGNFETAPFIHKVYHPQGGGVVQPRLPLGATLQVATTPAAGWYMGRFSNVEWTASTAQDVILVAYQISREICENINMKVNGSNTIPSLSSGFLRTVLIDDALHSGTNVDLTTNSSGICPGCDEVAALCVSNSAESAYAFYTIIADQ